MSDASVASVAVDDGSSSSSSSSAPPVEQPVAAAGADDEEAEAPADKLNAGTAKHNEPLTPRQWAKESRALDDRIIVKHLSNVRDEQELAMSDGLSSCDYDPRVIKAALRPRLLEQLRSHYGLDVEVLSADTQCIQRWRISGRKRGREDAATTSNKESKVEGATQSTESN